MAGSAISEITRQLRRLGGEGKIWVDNWRGRFGLLGDFKVFVESHPDKFLVIPGEGKDFSISLLLTEEEYLGKVEHASPGRTQDIDDSNPLVGAAINEIRSQVLLKGGEGKIWVDNWKHRFGELGEFKAFVESHPDKFRIVPGHGKDFAIGLVGSWASTHNLVVAAAVEEITQQVMASGGQAKIWVTDWKQRFGWQLGDFEGFVKSHPDKFKVIPDQGKSFAIALVGSKTSSRHVSQNRIAYNPLVAAAIREIKDQLRDKGGTAKIWIENWSQRFGSLGTIREFLESRPDKFAIIPGQGKDFAISLVEGANSPGHKIVGMKRPAFGGSSGVKRTRKEIDPSDPGVAEAIFEIETQLIEMGGMGKIWVEDWKGRFGQLGAFKDFVQCMPEKFEILPGTGKDFSLRLAGFDPAT